MSNPEKARLKAEFAKSLADEIQEALGNAERNTIGIAASRDSMERLFARMAGYRKRIDTALDDGTFPEASKEPVYVVFKDLVTLAQDAHQALKTAAAEQIPFAAGLRKAHNIAMDRARRELILANRAEELLKEDEEELPVAEVKMAEPEPHEMIEPPQPVISYLEEPAVVVPPPPPDMKLQSSDGRPPKVRGRARGQNP